MEEIMNTRRVMISILLALSINIYGMEKQEEAESSGSEGGLDKLVAASIAMAKQKKKNRPRTYCQKFVKCVIYPGKKIMRTSLSDFPILRMFFHKEGRFYTKWNYIGIDALVIGGIAYVLTREPVREKITDVVYKIKDKVAT